MINLSTSNFISNLLDSSDSENGSEKINEILAAIVGHSGSKLSAQDVVHQLVSGMESVSDESSVSEDPMLLNNIETQVQGYVDNCGSCDASENLQALNDLYSEINYLVKESLKAEQKNNLATDTAPVHSESTNDNVSAAFVASPTAEVLPSSPPAETNAPVADDFARSQNIDPIAFLAADRNNQITESVDASKNTGQSLSAADAEPSATINHNHLQRNGVPVRGRGSDLTLDMLPGAVIQIPKGVSMQQIQTEITRLRQAIDEARV